MSLVERQQEIVLDLLGAFVPATSEGGPGATPDLREWLTIRGVKEVDFVLVEECKREVDRQVRTDARRALQVATLTENLAQLSRDPLAQALGDRAKAMALHVLARFGEAMPLYERAYTLYRDADRPVEAARIGRAMVDALMYQGLYDDALRLADESRAILEEHCERVLAAQLESNVGNIYHRLDRNREALACYERAAAVFAEEAPEQLAQVTCNRANVLCNLDDFRQARALYAVAEPQHRALGQAISALQVRYSIGYLDFLCGAYHRAMRTLYEVRIEAESLGDRYTAALCILDLAEIHLQMNTLDEAAKLAAEARIEFDKLQMRYETAKAAVFFGLAELRRSNPATAALSFAAAREEFAAEGNEVYAALIDLYTAELELSGGDIVRALELAERAEATFLAQGLRTKLGAARLARARALSAGGQTTESLELATSVLEMCRDLEVPWLCYQAYELRGDSLLASGDGSAARIAYESSISDIERMRSTIRVDEFRSAFFGDKLRVYEKMIRLCLENDEPERAFFYLESSKARTMVDLQVAELEVAPQATGPAAEELRKRWSDLREELHWFYSKAGKAGTQSQGRWMTIETSLREEINQRERALSEVTRSLQVHDPHFEVLPPSAGLTVGELREILAADETVIEYYLDDQRLRIFVIDRGGLEVIESECTLRQLEDLILELRFHLDRFQYGDEYVREHLDNRLRPGMEHCLESLYKLLIAPAARHFKSQRLIIVPFGPLHNVPFEALYDGKAYLLEGYEVIHSPSAQLLKMCARRSAGNAGRALIFGIADETAPQISAETNAIREMFAGARCYSGAEATVEALTRNAADCDLLHISCHAVFRQDNPMFSALKLANGWFTFYDVSALKLEAPFVTLSGCSTGAQKVYAGDELMGLARGFLSAGASSLLVSLWAVDDEVTAKLMTAFYSRLREGIRPATALRGAALELKAKCDHPYYWSPFLLISRY